MTIRSASSGPIRAQDSGSDAAPVSRRPSEHRRRRFAAALALVAALSALTGGLSLSFSPESAHAENRTGGTSHTAKWSWPLAVPIIQRGYEAPAHRYGAGHRGIDLLAAEGESVLSPDDGVVHFAGDVAGKPVVSVDHGNGLISSFEPVDAVVSEGQSVEVGQPIGTVAASDHCMSCLHLGARSNGEYLSPLVLLGGVPRAVLLPLD